MDLAVFRRLEARGGFGYRKQVIKGEASLREKVEI